MWVRSPILLLACLAALLPASSAVAASSPRNFPLYIRATLAERYFSTQADGSSWESQASIDANYKTASRNAYDTQDLSLTPTGVVSGLFTAQLNGRGAGGTTDCTYSGLPIKTSMQLIVHEFGESYVEVPWPGFPSRWTQIRTSASTSDCPAQFNLNPLQGPPPEGETIWKPNAIYQNRIGAPDEPSAVKHFNSALVPSALFGNSPFREEQFVPSDDAVEMSSHTAYKGGELYTVEAWGTVVQSDVPITGARQNYLPLMPDLPTASLPSLNILRAQGSKEIKLPRGCVRGERRRKHQRCR